MKGLIQLSLLGIIFVIAILFYKSYFFENKSVKQEEVNDIKNQPSDQTIIKSNETFDTEKYQKGVETKNPQKIGSAA